MAQTIEQRTRGTGTVLINQHAVKTYIKSQRIGLRVSASYLQALNQFVTEVIDADIKINGSRKTITDAVVSFSSQFNRVSNVQRRKVR